MWDNNNKTKKKSTSWEKRQLLKEDMRIHKHRPNWQNAYVRENIRFISNFMYVKTLM